jgi:hypothetical protein
VTLPGGRVDAAADRIGIVDLGFCALAMYVLVPVSPIRLCRRGRHLRFRRRYWVSPAIRRGLGVFDAAMLVGLWRMDQDLLGRNVVVSGALLYCAICHICNLAVSGGYPQARLSACAN